MKGVKCELNQYCCKIISLIHFKKDLIFEIKYIQIKNEILNFKKHTNI